MTEPSPRTFAPRAILFDLDGLLVDSEPIWQEAERVMMKSWGATWTDEDSVASRGTGIPETLQRMAARAGRPFDAALDPCQLVEIYLGLAAHVLEKPGGRALASKARDAGARTAIASSSPRRVVMTVLEAVGMATLFDEIVTGDDVARKKPDPQIFLEAAARLGEGAEGCLVLEDSMPGVLAAKSASMSVIAVPEVDADAFVSVADAVARDLVEAARWIRFGR